MIIFILVLIRKEISNYMNCWVPFGSYIGHSWRTFEHFYLYKKMTGEIMIFPFSLLYFIVLIAVQISIDIWLSVCVCLLTVMCLRHFSIVQQGYEYSWMAWCLVKWYCSRNSSVTTHTLSHTHTNTHVICVCLFVFSFFRRVSIRQWTEQPWCECQRGEARCQTEVTSRGPRTLWSKHPRRNRWAVTSSELESSLTGILSHRTFYKI